MPVLDALSARLLDRLDDISQPFRHALDFGGRGAVAPALLTRGITVDSADFSPRLAASAGGTPRVLDTENFELPPATYDLIIAPFALHWTTDLPGALIQLRRALTPQGLFLAAMPALGTLQTLRETLLNTEDELTGRVSPRISPFPTLQDCAGLLQRAGFSLPVADIEAIDFLYANPLDLLLDLRAAGETNALASRSRRFAPRALFPAALSRLPQRDGRTIASLHMATLTGWAA